MEYPLISEYKEAILSSEDNFQDCAEAEAEGLQISQFVTVSEPPARNLPHFISPHRSQPLLLSGNIN